MVIEHNTTQLMRNKLSLMASAAEREEEKLEWFGRGGERVDWHVWWGEGILSARVDQDLSNLYRRKAQRK